MSEIRNTGISSLYLALPVNAQHENFKTFAVLVYAYGHVYTSYGHIKKPFSATTDNFINVKLAPCLPASTRCRRNVDLM